MHAVQPVEVLTNHVAMISHPDAVTDLIGTAGVRLSLRRWHILGQ